MIDNCVTPDLDICDINTSASAVLRYEQLVHWAREEWSRRQGDRPYMVLWASDDCADERARTRMTEGRRLKGKTRYQGYQAIDCPYSTPISGSFVRARKAVLTGSVGAFIFSFEAA